MNTCSQIEFFGFDDYLHLIKATMYRLLSLGKQVIIHESTIWIQVQNETALDSMGSLVYDTSVQYILNSMSGMFFSINYESRKEILEEYQNSCRNLML